MNSKTIKIAWLTNYPIELLQPELTVARIPRLGHPVSWIVNLAKAFAKTPNVDLHIITASAGIRKSHTFTKDGITFHVIRHTFPFTTRGFPDYMPLHQLTRYAYLRRQIKKVILKVQPDLIHVHGTEFGYGLAALQTEVPTIVSIQGLITLYAQVYPSIRFRFQAPIERFIISRAKYFGSRTAWANSFIRKLNKTAIIYDLPEAINEVFFEQVAKSPNQNILLVGTIEQRKGIKEALDAMSIILATCPSSKLFVVGEGEADYTRELKQLTKSAGIEASVEWLGFKTANEIATLHAKSAILIQPSYMDNSPNSVAEAMVSGLPVIASNVGGIPSMIENGVTGILVEPKNHFQLAEAVITILSDDAARERLASNAKRVAFERHFPSIVAEKTLRVYDDIVAKEKINSLH